MSPYLTHKEIIDFEDKIGYSVLKEKNKAIGKFLGFEPEIEWMVGNDQSSCFHPKSCGFDRPEQQKQEAERWLTEQRNRFPRGWVVQEGNSVVKREYYPQFHLDWNHLMEAIKRMNAKGITIGSSTDIFYTWQLLYQNCN